LCKFTPVFIKTKALHKRKITELDSRQFFNCFLAGAGKIFDDQSYMNKINVFPVADADTGTNLASTMRSIVETTVVHSHFKATAVDIADAALAGARGNSGIIFAQFLYGFSFEVADKEKIDTFDFVLAAKKAVPYVYEAIADPVEGTMVSVIKEWADHIFDIMEKYDDFYSLLTSGLKQAHKSLKETTKKLDKLARAKVVDAGARGFVDFLEGVIDYIKTGRVPNPELLKSVVIEISNDHIHHDTITFRYCTEALIQGENLSKEKLKAILDGFGDSMVIAGAKNKIRIHIHTDTPWLLFEKISDMGTVIAQKVDDMVMQNEVASNARFKTVIVTDSSCDIPEDLLEKYQIQCIPLNIHFGDTFYLDGVTMKPEQFYAVLDSSPVYPTTSQPSYKEFFNRYNYLSTHYDSIIGINLSAKLSGTWQNSVNAAGKVSALTGKIIDVINSKKVSCGLGLLTIRAAKALATGMSHEEIVAYLPMWVLKTKQFAGLKTLKYLVKSGRIDAKKGFFGRLLGIKPIIEVDKNGLVIPFSKPFSEKKSRKQILNEMKKFMEKKSVWGYAITHADNPDSARKLAREMEKLTGKKPEFIQQVTPVLGVHVGTGVVSLAVLLV
jgi:DegV family protein with EDD domain